VQNFSLTSQEIAQHVTDYGVKGYSDGMAFTADGRLFYGNMQANGISVWNVSQPLSSAVLVCSNDTTMMWPDTFAFDGHYNLLFVSNKLPQYVFGGMKFDGSNGANFRIWRIAIGANSYLSAQTPHPASLPCFIYS